MSRRIEDVQQFAEFRRALRRFERTTELAAQGAGLTPRQYILLLAVEGAPGGERSATIGELADALQLAQSTITGLVDRAEASGIVSRHHSPRDGRVVCVELTDLGRERLERTMAALDADRESVRRAAAAVGPHLRD